MFKSTQQNLTLAAITTFVICASPAVAQVANEELKLLPDDGAAGSQYGNSVAICGTTAVIGARRDDANGSNSGSVYLFNTITGEQIIKLLPDDGALEDWFGECVAISESTAVVGSRLDDDNGDQSGSVYFFDTTTGMQTNKIQPTDGAEYDNFGNSVAISGTTVVVGAFFDDDNGSFSGAAYLFDTTTGMQTFKLLPDDGAEGDEFGCSVAIYGTIAVIGANMNNDNGRDSGSAYLFDTVTGQQIAKLLPNDGGQFDRFGTSVAISGNTAVVGAYLDNDNGLDSGSAYLFDTSTGKQITKLLPNDGAQNDWFGWSVAISGNTTLVGARWDDDNGQNSGSAYLFDSTTGQQITKLVPSDGASDDFFGWSVAMTNTTAVISSLGDDDNGSSSGSAYTFTTESPCTADLSGDGSLDFFDVSAFLTAYAANDPTADFNADSSFNFFDVSAFLVAYLAGCQ